MSIDEERVVFYWEIEPISVAFFDPAWSYQNDEAEEQAASKALQGQIEAEVCLPVGITSIGTGAAAPGFLVMLPSVAFGGAIWLFFKGKEIQPNIDAWRDLYERYITKILHRKPYFDRGGSAALAIEEITKRLGREPQSILLLSYKRRSHMAPEDMSTGKDGEIDDRRRIESASIHVFHIEADKQHFVVHVDGTDVTFIEP